MINEELLTELFFKASWNERKRIIFDQRITLEYMSQRMLNALEPGTHVPIHRHLKISETIICIEGCMDWVFYQELPNMDAGGPIHDGTTVVDETQFVECGRFRICPREGMYGIQIPQGAWHSIEVYEPSTIFEAKDGKFLR